MGAIFYWQKAHISLDISPEAVKAKCLEDVSKITDEELINEVKNLKYPEEIVSSTGENRILFANKQMINYLICKVRYEKDENLYNKAKSFIEELTIQGENKEKTLARLNDSNKLDSFKLDSFSIQVALGDLSQICPDKLSDLCLKEAVQFSIDQKEAVIKDCGNVCNIIKQYSENKDKLEKEVINNKKWIDEIYENQYRFRTSIAYRFGGQNLASEVCNNIKNSERDKCIDWIEIINNQESKIEECSNIQKVLEELICQSPIDEIE